LAMRDYVQFQVQSSQLEPRFHRVKPFHLTPATRHTLLTRLNN
jgi:hypothetical protein